jgi:hypothetical protein
MTLAVRPVGEGRTQGVPATCAVKGRRRTERGTVTSAHHWRAPDQNEVSTGKRRPRRAQGYQELDCHRWLRPYPLQIMLCCGGEVTGDRGN